MHFDESEIIILLCLASPLFGLEHCLLSTDAKYTISTYESMEKTIVLEKDPITVV